MRSRKWKKIIVIMAMCCLVSITVHAQEQDVVQVGAVLEKGNSNEKVLRVNEDGTYVTVVLDETDTVSVCQHETLSNYRTYSQMEILGEKVNCRRIRVVKDQKCVNCGKTGIKEYGLWKYVGHEYSWLSNECGVCGRRK